MSWTTNGSNNKLKGNKKVSWDNIGKITYQNLWDTARTALTGEFIAINVYIKKQRKWKWKSLSRVWLFMTPWTIEFMEFSRPEYWSGLPFPSSGDLPNPGMEPRSPALQADSLPAETQGKPKNTGVSIPSSISLLQQIFPAQESNQP